MSERVPRIELVVSTASSLHRHCYVLCYYVQQSCYWCFVPYTRTMLIDKKSGITVSKGGYANKSLDNNDFKGSTLLYIIVDVRQYAA